MCRLGFAQTERSLGQLQGTTRVIRDVYPLLHLTALTELALDCGQLFPSFGELSALTALRSLAVNVPAIDPDEDLYLPLDIEVARPMDEYLPLLVPNSHTGLFGLTGLTKLSLNGGCVQALHGIEALTCLESLHLMEHASLDDLSQLSSLSTLTSLELLCQGNSDLAPVNACPALGFLKLASEYDPAEVSGLKVQFGGSGKPYFMVKGRAR